MFVITCNETTAVRENTLDSAAAQINLKQIIIYLFTLECCSRNLAIFIALIECLSILTGSVFKLLCSRDASNGDYKFTEDNVNIQNI